MSHAAPSRLPRLFTFVGADQGPWAVRSARTLMGDALPPATCLQVVEGAAVPSPRGAAWALAGITSNEKVALVGAQAGLGRDEATRAALIPIRKSSAWWALTQDERRAVFESQSHHIAIGMGYIPAVARRLHHCRDLGPAEPFDFLTWFDYAPEHEPAFDELLKALRNSPEWAYVDREVDIRLVRVPA